MPFIPHTPESPPARLPAHLIQRNDSKNPLKTCRGVTSTGRPCRRALPLDRTMAGLVAANEDVPLSSEVVEGLFCWQHKEQAGSMVMEIRRAAQQQQLERRHQESLQIRQQQKPRGEARATTTLRPTSAKVGSVRVDGMHKGRSSIETLIERVGILDLDDPAATPPTNGHAEKESQKTRPTREKRPHQSQQPKRKPSRTPSSSWLSLFCCLGSARDEELLPGPRPWQKQGRASLNQSQNQSQDQSRAQTHRPPMTSISAPAVIALPISATPAKRTPQGPLLSSPPRAPYLLPSDRTYTTQRHHRPAPPPPPPQSSQSPPSSPPPRRSPLSPPTISTLPGPASKATATTTDTLIPLSLPPSTRTLLATELSKPFSRAEEPGYIYIFKISDAFPTQDDGAAEPGPKFQRRPDRQRARNETAPASPSATALASRGSPGQNLVYLKIGRTSNVQRRLNEWSAQCGHAVTLLRYYPNNTSFSSASSSPAAARNPSRPSSRPHPYPHLHSTTHLTSPPPTLSSPSSPSPPSSSSSSSDAAARKTPHPARVERLIHLELAAYRSGPPPALSPASSPLPSPPLPTTTTPIPRNSPPRPRPRPTITTPPFSPPPGPPHASLPPPSQDQPDQPDEPSTATKCTCGHTHREWFAIPATPAGLRAVDAVVRRWVGWDSDR
ncbi:MAG: hypothetical protein M1819_007101 [Sarea resinae]|nr:MAG: hypothetical protein M1819_007101 [Sarea resinae]